jgi:hypothetical protein
MIKNKKGILIIVISLVIVYFAICLFQYISNTRYKKTVFLGASTKVSINDGKIKVKNDNSKIDNLKVKVYFNKEFINGIINSFKDDSDDVNNSYMVSNENGERLALDTILVAHTRDISIKIKEPDTRSINDSEEIYKFANANNISLPSSIEIVYMNVKTIDVDEDGDLENIYSVGFVKENNEFESIVFLKKENKYILITNKTTEYDVFKNEKLSFYKLIDFNNDNDYEFVVNRRMSEYGPDYYELYNFDGKKFTKIGGE